MEEITQPLLVTRDANLAEAVEASAAAAGVALRRVTDADEARRYWRTAPIVLVGADAAAGVAGSGARERPGVYLIGARLAALVSWSVPLGAAVLTLPDDAGALASVLTASSAGGRGRTLWVLGASGGLGVSSLVVGLGVIAAKASRVAVVELAPHGGGLDLMFGVETAPGWRWPDLAGASGQLGELAGLIPSSHGVDVVSQGRRAASPGGAALTAVFGSLARSHDLVLVDGGLARPPGRDVRPLLLVGADVASVSAARALAGEVDLADAEVVVRTGPGRSIAPGLVADALGLPLGGRLPTDARLPRLLEAGRPPGSVGGRFRRAASRLLQAVA